MLPDKINWDDFTTEKLVFKHPNLTNDDLLSLREKLSTSFYFKGTYLKRIEQKIKKFPHLKGAWLEFFYNARKNNLLPKYNKDLNELISYFEKISC